MRRVGAQVRRRYAPPDVQITYHNIRRPSGREIEGRDFDALIVSYDLLSLRSSAQWPWVLEEVAPLADRAEGVRAFPQDDYTHNAVLDEGLERIGADVIFTPIETGLEIVYPTMHKKARIRHALTGYVDETTAMNRRRSWKPIPDRARLLSACQEA